MPSVVRKRHLLVENATSQVTNAGESSSTPSSVRQLHRKGVKNEWKDEKTEGAADCSLTSRWPRHDPIFIAPSCSVRRLDSLCLLGQDRATGETNYCIEELTLKDILDPIAHLFFENGMS